MCRGGKAPADSSPAPPARDSRSTPAARPQGSPNLIEFVDSQDPNVKSTIQRHTAYHSAAQRREARLQSLRQGGQSGYLEWGRRQEPTSMPSTPPEGSSSLQTESSVLARPRADDIPGSSRTSLVTTTAPELAALSRGTSRESTPISLGTEEESLLQLCGFYFLLQHQLPRTSHSSMDTIRALVMRDLGLELTSTGLQQLMEQHSESRYETAIAFMRLDEACTQLLLAYSYQLRAMLGDSDHSNEADRQAAHERIGRGTNILWNRLRDWTRASSDPNIQAVLLLVSYASDFGERAELELHMDALRTMVEQRGGLDGLEGNSVLHRQLSAMDSARKFHLTLDCDEKCEQELRFPDGFWAKTRLP